jgi:hypothetical protein
VFVQWMGLQFVDEGLLRSLIATLLSVFPHVRLYQADPGSVLFRLLARPLRPREPGRGGDGARSGDLRARGLRVREDLAAALSLDEEGGRKLAEGAPLATDDKNRFATHSPRVLGRAIGNIDRMVGPHDPLVRRLGELDALYLVRHLVRTDRVKRAQRLAAKIGDRWSAPWPSSRSRSAGASRARRRASWSAPSRSTPPRSGRAIARCRSRTAPPTTATARG